jgi:hypothetical protein
MKWHNTGNIASKEYKCGFCGYIVASVTGYHGGDNQNIIYLCPHCNKPSYFGNGFRVPGIAPGNEVEHIPENIESLYREARNCVSVSANTSAVLACRKLLMNIAVEQGAKEGESFLKYVDFLASSGYVPPNGKGWVDHIRKKGNEATHEIKIMVEADAVELISFAEMLLKFIYEFPNKIP